MVILSEHSPYSKNQTPFLHKWDTAYRKSHAMYQREIDRITYHLQRSQRGLWLTGSWLYPYLHQRELLLLELYKKKQLLGGVFKEDIEGYEKINPDIQNDLNKVFNAHWYIPWGGLLAAGLLNVGAAFINLQYSYRLGLVILPVAFDYLYQKNDVSAYNRSLQFLNFAVEYRKARAQIELDKEYFTRESGQIFQRFRHTVKNPRPVFDIYSELINLVGHENVGELTD